jgi:hypothetical protein
MLRESCDACNVASVVSTAGYTQNVCPCLVACLLWHRVACRRNVFVQEKIETELREARQCVKSSQLGEGYKPRLRGDLVSVRDIMASIPRLQVRRGLPCARVYTHCG